MAQNDQNKNPKDLLKRAEIKTMRGDILMAQGLAGRKDFRAKEREMEQIILQKRRAEQERPKAPAIKTDTEKELRETTVSKGEEAIRTFETERTRETLQIKLESERLELEEKRKKERKKIRGNKTKRRSGIDGPRIKKSQRKRKNPADRRKIIVRPRTAKHCHSKNSVGNRNQPTFQKRKTAPGKLGRSS